MQLDDKNSRFEKYKFPGKQGQNIAMLPGRDEGLTSVILTLYTQKSFV